MTTLQLHSNTRQACLYLGGDTFVPATTGTPLYTTTEYFKVKSNRWEEAIYYLELNRVPLMNEAARRKLIGGYLLLSMPWNSGSRYDFILRTDFITEEQYFFFEERITGLTRILRPNGPDLMTDADPDVFLHQAMIINRKNY